MRQYYVCLPLMFRREPVMSEERVFSMRESVDLIERQESALSRWCRGSGYVWVLLALCFVSLHGRVEPAQAEPGRFEVGAKLAPSLEQHLGERDSAAVNAYKPGISFGVGVRYASWRDWFSTQAEILYATRGSNVDLDGRTEGSFYFTYLELPVLARFRIPVGSGAVRPKLSSYAIIGPSVSFLLDAKIEDAGGTRSLDRNGLNEFDFGAVAGVGVTLEVTPEWALSLEARYDQGVRDAFKGADTDNQAFLLTLGVDRTFGHGNSDGDHLADYQDSCRFEAVDMAQDRDRDGCPDATPGGDDEDGDGILAKDDECLDKKEDPNGYRDEDGCPDGHLDTDRDGLADAKDKCPEQPFSRAGNIKYAKAYNQERPGCPVVRVDGDRLALDPRLEFDQGVEVVGETQVLILDEVAFFWKGRPKLCLRVEGHADKLLTHGEQENQRESLLRAQSVTDYLVKRGVERDFLIPKGYGSRVPISREDDPEGKRKNRRVEFALVEQSECDQANKPASPRR